MSGIAPVIFSGMIAPLEGVMTPPFINAVTQLELSKILMTPFMRISGSVWTLKVMRNFLAPYIESQLPLIVQIMGTSPEKMAAAAKILTDNFPLIGINLNFGCPSKTVMSGGAGGAMLKNLELMLKITSEVRGHMAQCVGLSAKIRLGFENPMEAQKIIPGLADKSGLLDFLVVHTRTVKEHYLPIVDMAMRRQMAVELAGKLPVIINGDINSEVMAREVLAQSGAAGFMAGRFWLKNPGMLRKFNGLPWKYDEADSRDLFYQTVLNEAEKCETPYSVGKKIELSNFIFGSKNPYFAELAAQNRRN